MAPRGLSAEEKRVKLLEIFHESKDFYQLKELEKLGPKLKGIVSQSVKEVLQSLVDDGLVQTDKIGSSNCLSFPSAILNNLERNFFTVFWSFPSQRGSIMQNRLAAAKEAKAAHENQLKEIGDSISSEKAFRQESEVRATALESLAMRRKELLALEKELGEYGACDPVKMEEKRRGVTLAHEAAIRWTDNYTMLLSHFTRQHAVDTDEIRKFLGVGDDYEDIC